MTTECFEAAWWERGIIYQIYPRSFQDSNADGVGDLRGIMSRLDYLDWLGVDAIWISPIYPSPMRDFGYDISDYTGISPLFGTLEEFDELVAEAHRRDIRVILDFVPNHTSDEHPWFIESRSSRESDKRDWYVWRNPGPDGGPPNNWLSHFGGEAWTFDEATGQYYLHSFLAEQPDLNWRNPEVQQAMYDVLRFWLKRGVDGFRIDVLYQIIKDDEFRDDPPNPDWVPEQGPYNRVLHIYSMDRPEVHEIAREMRRVLEEYGDGIMIGEIWLPVEKLVTYYGHAATGTHLPLNFQLIQLPWHASAIREAIREYEDLIPRGGWPNWVLGNHDIHRIATRVGMAQAKVAAIMLLMLRGTPTMYYGDEIGMIDVPIPAERLCDPFELNVPGLGLGRDPQRTPMQWREGSGAGFSETEPWLPIPDDLADSTVEDEREDPESLLSLYRDLIALRRRERALQMGDYEEIEAEGDVLAWTRVCLRADTGTESRFLIAINLSREPTVVHVPGCSGEIVLSTHPDQVGKHIADQIRPAGNEGMIVRVS